MNYVKCKVVMLPTEKASIIYSIRKNRSEFNLVFGGPVPIKRNVPSHGYHLYILSNEEIKENDWYYREKGLERKAGIFKSVTQQKLSTGDTKRYKVTASTDTELKIPRPSNLFIEKYCQLSGKIDDVLVEYVEVKEPYTFYHGASAKGMMMEETINKPKVAPDNTITIKPVVLKKYTREEVIAFVTPLITESCKEKGSSQKEIGNVIEFWININLNGN